MPRLLPLTLLVGLTLLAVGPDASAQTPRLAGTPRPVAPPYFPPRNVANFGPGFGYYPMPFGFNNFGGYYFLPTGYGLNAGFDPPVAAAPLDVSGVGFSGTFARSPATAELRFVTQDTVVTRWRSIVAAGK